MARRFRGRVDPIELEIEAALNPGAFTYQSGEIESARLDVGALGLTPLTLKDEGEWDPKGVGPQG
jgi:hypothetical protein